MEMKDRPDQVLAGLADEYWQTRLGDVPLFATALGYRKFDDRLTDITPDGRLRVEMQYKDIFERCERIHEDGLAEADRLTRTVLLTECKSQLEYSSCRLEEWTVDPLEGPQVEFLNVESYQPVTTPEEGRAMARRWLAIGSYLDDQIANLGRGLAEGKVAVSSCVVKSIDELHDLLAKPDSEWTFLRPLKVPHEEWSRADLDGFRAGLTRAVWESIRPAFARYLEFLKGQVLPRARPQEHAGLVNLPGGLQEYSRLVRVHTSLGVSPDELHQTGLAEVARINREMEELGRKVFGTGDRRQILHRLRTDKSLYFSDREEVFAKAEAALAKAKDAIERWFGRLPRADCEVVRMEEHEEKHSTIAYYRQPAADGSRPGCYYINTYAPETRPRYEAEALAYHESIPGHHLQLAIAQELEGIPEFRRMSGVTAFIEGWGLYSERLSDEMGLYTSDMDRIGILSYDAWRACRLVVDTGMHAKRWGRQQAIDFMIENTALAENNIVNEVDRYIAWPGQALAYKAGQLEMMRLRSAVKERLGDRFDIRHFHDVLLGNGAIPLESLRKAVEQSLR